MDFIKNWFIALDRSKLIAMILSLCAAYSVGLAVTFYEKGKHNGINETISKMQLATAKALEKERLDEQVRTKYAVIWASELAKTIALLSSKEREESEHAKELALESHRGDDCNLTDNELHYYQALARGTAPQVAELSAHSP